MTGLMVVGSMILLSIVVCMPELIGKFDKVFAEEEPFPVITWRHHYFVEFFELTDDWFVREPEPKRNVWRLKNAKCGWSPLPGTWKRTQHA